MYFSCAGLECDANVFVVYKNDRFTFKFNNQSQNIPQRSVVPTREIGNLQTLDDVKWSGK